MKIIVTGIAGFIGSHLARRLLTDGHDVVGVDELNDYYAVSLKRDRLSDIAKTRSFEFVELDIADLEAMRALFARHHDATHIVHLAAQAGVRYSLERPELYVHANVMGQVSVLESALRLDRCVHILYASTSSVYGANRDLPFSPGQRVETPVSLYQRHQARGRAYRLHLRTSARPRRDGIFASSPSTGRGAAPTCPYYKFAKAIAAGEPISIHGMGRCRAISHMWTTWSPALVAALTRPPAADITGVHHKLYNIGNNRPTQLLDFVDMIERAMGRKNRTP